MVVSNLMGLTILTWSSIAPSVPLGLLGSKFPFGFFDVNAEKLQLRYAAVAERVALVVSGEDVLGEFPLAEVAVSFHVLTSCASSVPVLPAYAPKGVSGLFSGGF